MLECKAVLLIDIDVESSDPDVVLEEFSSCKELSSSNVKEKTQQSFRSS